MEFCVQKLHFITSISPTKKMLFHTELMLTSLEQVGIKDYHFTLIIGCENKNDLNEIENYAFVKKRTEIIHSPFDWKTHKPAQLRWELEPQASHCVIIDVDLLFIKPIGDEVCNDFICGVIAYDTPFNQPLSRINNWESLYYIAGLTMPSQRFQHYHFNVIHVNDDQRYCPGYFNMGFVCCPADIYKSIGLAKSNVLNTLNRVGYHYHAGQLSLALAITACNAHYSTLPLSYNFPDFDKYYSAYSSELQNMVCFHLLHGKNLLSSWEDVKWQALYAKDHVLKNSLIKLLKNRNAKII